MKKSIILILSICVIGVLFFLGYKIGNDIHTNNVSNSNNVNSANNITYNNSNKNNSEDNSDSSYTTQNSNINNTNEDIHSDNVTKVNGFTNHNKSNIVSKQGAKNVSNLGSDSIVQSYFGTWKVSNSIGYAIEGISGDYPSMTGKELRISNNLYEFNGVNISNPHYYVKKVSSRILFGEDGATGILGNSDMLNVLFVSQQALSNSEIENLEPQGLIPTIIFYNSKIYIFGGGKNYSEIYSTYLIK